MTSLGFAFGYFLGGLLIALIATFALGYVDPDWGPLTSIFLFIWPVLFAAILASVAHAIGLAVFQRQQSPRNSLFSGVVAATSAGLILLGVQTTLHVSGLLPGVALVVFSSLLAVRQAPPLGA